jgi:DNA-binding NtrC family response regulator
MVDDLRSGTWVTYVDGKAASLFVRRCRLSVVGGQDAGTVREVESSVLRIGARRGCELELKDGKVSGVHCEIRLEERGYRLRDLESTNGTYVSGLRVQDVFIPPGTIITLGNTKVRFDALEGGVPQTLSAADSFGGLVGRSVKMRELFAKLEKISPTDATVLITGETGTGKELVAEAVHDRSTRADGPFVVLDCGSIPPNLVESELFGHERGAFTGAHATHAGAFERAHGGTVFLDEIGELPIELQPKLLRVLERKEIRRVGGSKTISTDIRVVAATNRDLGVEVNRGRFREDLFYRLAVARVHVPPLRERREDIPLLIEHFMSITPGARAPALREETIELLRRHDWPGNVRELRNVIERAVLLSESPGDATGLRGVREVMEAEAGAGGAAPRTDEQAGTPTSGGSAAPQRFSVAIDTAVPYKLAKHELVEEFERRYIRALLEAHGGNISAAARAAGIDRMSIHKILNRLGLDPRK